MGGRAAGEHKATGGTKAEDEEEEAGGGGEVSGGGRGGGGEEEEEGGGVRVETSEWGTEVAVTQGMFITQTPGEHSVTLA